MSAWSSASRPFCSVSPRVSRWYHCRILLRARDDAGDREPVARRPAARLRGEDLDEVAVLQVVVERDDPAVHLGADGPVADVRVDGVREVDGARAGRQRLHLALRREDVHLVVEEVRAQRSHVLGRVLLVPLPVHERANPREPLVVPLPGLAALVEPVRGDAELGLLVHLPGAHLDLERRAGRPDHRRVQRAVAVQLRHRDEVLEPAGHRLPERVDEPERAVAVARPLLARAVGDHAHGREVVDLVELPALLGHLVVDRVEVLRAPRDQRRGCRPSPARARGSSPPGRPATRGRRAGRRPSP